MISCVALIAWSLAGCCVDAGAASVDLPSSLSKGHSRRLSLLRIDSADKLELNEAGISAIQASNLKLQSVLAFGGAAQSLRQSVLASAASGQAAGAGDWPLPEENAPPGVDLILFQSRDDVASAVLDIHGLSAVSSELAAQLFAVAELIADRVVWITHGTLGSSDVDLLESLSMLAEAFQGGLPKQKDALPAGPKGLEFVVLQSLTVGSSRDTRKEDTDWAKSVVASSSVTGFESRLPAVYRGSIGATFLEEGWPISGASQGTQLQAGRDEGTLSAFNRGSKIDAGYLEGVATLSDRIGLTIGTRANGGSRPGDAIARLLRVAVRTLREKSLLGVTGEVLDSWSALNSRSLGAAYSKLEKRVGSLEQELNAKVRGSFPEVHKAKVLEVDGPLPATTVVSEFDSTAQKHLQNFYASVGDLFDQEAISKNPESQNFVAQAVERVALMVSGKKSNIINLATSKVDTYVSTFQQALLKKAKGKANDGKDPGSGATSASGDVHVAGAVQLSTLRRRQADAEALVMRHVEMLNVHLSPGKLNEVTDDTLDQVSKEVDRIRNLNQRAAYKHFSEDLSRLSRKSWNEASVALNAAKLNGKGVSRTAVSSAIESWSDAKLMAVVDPNQLQGIIRSAVGDLASESALKKRAQKVADAIVDVSSSDLTHEEGEFNRQLRLQLQGQANQAKLDSKAIFAALSRQNLGLVQRRVKTAMKAAEEELKHQAAIPVSTIKEEAGPSIAEQRFRPVLSAFDRVIGDVSLGSMPAEKQVSTASLAELQAKMLTSVQGAISKKRVSVFDSLLETIGVGALIKRVAVPSFTVFGDPRSICLQTVRSKVFMDNANVRREIKRKLQEEGLLDGGSYDSVVDELMGGEVVLKKCPPGFGFQLMSLSTAIATVAALGVSAGVYFFVAAGKK